MELPAATPELVDALRADHMALMRDALLWQRWIRYAGFAIGSALVLIFGSLPLGVVGPRLAAVGLFYLLAIAGTSWRVQRHGLHDEFNIPAIAFTADMLMLGGFGWLAGEPADAYRLLVAAPVVIHMAVFYFGRRMGTYVAVLGGVTYLLVVFATPAASASARATLAGQLLTVGVYSFMSGALIYAYGGFRDRLNQLRLFCRLVEEGELTSRMPLAMDKRPDDLTLLARSFDTMRVRLAEQIGTDPLTGCLNRRALETRLRAEWRQAKRRGTTVAVLAIDLDRFKRINDTRGHPFGDVVLQELAGIFKATARDTDVVTRLGGDEFVIVLPDTGWQGALTFAERLRQKVEDNSFGTSLGGIQLTISVGVAMARGTDPISPDMLLQEADRSLYKAKSGGRNRVFA